MKTFYLFLVGCGLPGLGGVIGSIFGHGFGSTGLRVGGVFGGLVASAIVAWIAVRVKWVASERRTSTTVGTMVGFLAAALVAVNTLSSPIGPVLSTLLSGAGAVLGSRGFRSHSPT